MPPTALLTTIETLLDRLECSPGQRTLARSLSLAGAVSHLLGITPRELLDGLRPASDALAAADAATMRDAVEGRR